MSESVETTETVETETPQTSGGDGGGTGEHGEADKEGKPEPTYLPNYKFKSYDKEEEIPERFRALIKDAKSEEEVRKVFEKSYGFDGLKAISLKEKEELGGKAKTYEDQLNQTAESLKKIHHYSQNDLDTFFQVYKIPKERLIQYVAEKLQESELPQHEQQRLEQGRTSKFEADYYREQVELEKGRNQQLFKQQHDFAMSSAMSSPDVGSFQKSFDTKMGQGAFLQHVNDYGDKIFRHQNRYASPQESVKAMMDYFGKGFITPNPPMQSSGQEDHGSEASPPVIPNVGSGRSVSPTKARFKSLDQLKKHVKEQFKEA